MTTTKTIATTVSLDLADRFKRIAKDNDRSVNAELRRLVERYVVEREEAEAA